MKSYDNRYMGPWMNAPGTSMPWYMSPGAQHSPYYRQGMDPMYSGAMAYPMIYPDIYYKLQPYIINAGDRMEMYGGTPSEQMIDRMVDEIREEVMKLHPEIADYAKDYAEQLPMRQDESVPTHAFPSRFQDYRGDNMMDRDESVQPQAFPSRFQDYIGDNVMDRDEEPNGGAYPGRFGHTSIFPRRGLFSDLIRILLLTEIRRRRRRRCY